MLLCTGLGWCAQEPAQPSEKKVATNQLDSSKTQSSKELGKVGDKKLNDNNQLTDTAKKAAAAEESVSKTAYGDATDSLSNNIAVQQPIKPAERTSLIDYLGLVAIILCVVLFFYIRLITNDKKKKKTNTKAPDLNKLKKSVDDVSGQLALLTSRVSNLEDKVTSLSRNKPTVQQVVTPAPRQEGNTGHSSRQAQKTEYFYASSVKDGVFPTSTLKSNADKFTLFILTVTGNTGTFAINDAPEVQRGLISGFQYTVAKVADIRTKSAVPSRVVTVSAGSVVKSGNGWQVTKRAVVDLI